MKNLKYKVGDVVYCHTSQRLVIIKEVLKEGPYDYIVEFTEGISGWFRTHDCALSDKKEPIIVDSNLLSEKSDINLTNKPTILSARDRGRIDEIIKALRVLEDEKMLCYADEIEFLKKDTNMVDNDIIQSLTYDEKIECIVSALVTPIYRRKIKDEILNKLIADVYFEMKERKENNYE